MLGHEDTGMKSGTFLGNVNVPRYALGVLREGALYFYWDALLWVGTLLSSLGVSSTFVPPAKQQLRPQVVHVDAMHFQHFLALAVSLTATLIQVADAAPLPIDGTLEERQLLGLSLPLGLTLDLPLPSLPALGIPLPTGLIPDLGLPALTALLPALPLPTGVILGLPAALTSLIPALPLPTGILPPGVLPFKEAHPPAPAAVELGERQLDILSSILGALPSILPLPLPTGVVPVPSAPLPPPPPAPTPAPTATAPAAGGDLTDVVSSLLSVLVPLITNVNVGGALPTPPAVTGGVGVPSVTVGLPVLEPILETLLPGLGL
ncbi:unnamed protein product [Cyclocybe aegerita]|uniref:Uncharacterized protein n=1 Tax=Cyclocybe aegerita TaxID=1973307 RepID=A0A8S0VU83_CYCAE|nr:unnamed protein product [Cyclocybe aegerita]